MENPAPRALNWLIGAARARPAADDPEEPKRIAGKQAAAHEYGEQQEQLARDRAIRDLCGRQVSPPTCSLQLEERPALNIGAHPRRAPLLFVLQPLREV